VRQTRMLRRIKGSAKRIVGAVVFVVSMAGRIGLATL